MQLVVTIFKELSAAEVALDVHSPSPSQHVLLVPVAGGVHDGLLGAARVRLRGLKRFSLW